MNIEKFYTTVRGGTYHNSIIKCMLENPLYKGTTHYKDNKVKNKELALIYLI